MVSVLVKLFAVMLSIVTVSEEALVIRIADCATDGGSVSDQRRASSQKPFVELMQLFVCACETATRIAFVAIATVSQTAFFIPGLTRCRHGHLYEVVEWVAM